MDGTTKQRLIAFNDLVDLKYEMYNSLFTALPFQKVEKTGVLLSLFLLQCEEGFRKEQSPEEIIQSFFKQTTSYVSDQEKTDLLFKFVQYAERQVVLFDALEDAAYQHIHDVQGSGTMKHLQSEVIEKKAYEDLTDKLKDFSIRLVLTAHPTQFYPGEVLGIINDLSDALENDDTTLVKKYLEQLGKTPFFKKEKPTPYDEARSLIWFLENIFYKAASRILYDLKEQFPGSISEHNPLIRMGFWPGGDRDGNPFVDAETTLRVTEALRTAALRAYYNDVLLLKRRLTFKGIKKEIDTLSEELYKDIFNTEDKKNLSKDKLKDKLLYIKKVLIEKHNSLFLDLVDNLISNVELFGTYFASLDIRQDSSIHKQLLDQIVDQSTALPKNYHELGESDKIEALLNIQNQSDQLTIDDDVLRDTLEVMRTMYTIQQNNGEEACHRYIISHSTSALDVMEVYGLFLLNGWKKTELSVDIVPLFETIDDLHNAKDVMRALYENETYRAHLKRRNSIQTIMLGFSDGTKDGGYLMANWSIYTTKEELSELSAEYDIEVVFFDGRGGPPARGGGKTHQFYASMGRNIANKEIQLTIQGQTVSSNFGTVDAAQYNMEQLMHAGISNTLFSTREVTLDEKEKELMKTLSEESYKAYDNLKNDDAFLEYLSFASPLKYYSQTNIGSRPSKRSKEGKLNLNDLRAVPYIGAWSQLKQNLPGYYGVGTALKKMEEDGKWEELKSLYQNSLYFKTLLDNCEMAMIKCYFPLTAYLSRHDKYGELWNDFYNEYELTKKYVLRLSGSTELMADRPIDRRSIQMRQRIELPLITIQQYALMKIREPDVDRQLKDAYEKLVVRCSFGIINAERNSA